MRKNVALGIILASFSLLHPSRSQHQSGVVRQKSRLALVAEPTKPVYQRGETVEFKFTLRNISGVDVIVGRHLALTLNIDLKISDSHGKTAEWCGRIADQIIMLKSRYTILSPGASKHAKLAISCLDQADPKRAWGYRLDRKGKYVIRASYRLPQSKEELEKAFPNAHVDQGPVWAEPVTIEIQ
jgi:hypothetical protein